ncbi:hypothetical protein N7467_001894 [Penicillium canescens]|nr:hypothetical protein N7467_001894 [Penicillium canescens]
MASFKNVLLIGAGGNLGVPVLKAFLTSPYKVSVLTREESILTFPKDVPVSKADYTNIYSIKVAMKGQDVVISMVGGIAAGDQQVFIDAAIALVRHVAFATFYATYIHMLAHQLG